MLSRKGFSCHYEVSYVYWMKFVKIKAYFSLRRTAISIWNSVEFNDLVLCDEIIRRKSMKSVLEALKLFSAWKSEINDMKHTKS